MYMHTDESVSLPAVVLTEYIHNNTNFALLFYELNYDVNCGLFNDVK